MKKSKFFRVGVEGDTADGRIILRSDIEQAAKNYNPEKYGARINCEHILGLSPDGPFKAYGDVLALKTENFTIDGEEKLALMAQISPTDELVLLNKKRQKVYFSMEIHPDFKKSGEAYLVGLAITDNPASLGTEMMKLAAGCDTSPYADRKFDKAILFAATHEATLEFDDETPLLDKIKSMFTKQHANQSEKDNEFTQAITALATEMGNINERVSAIANESGSDIDTDKFTALLADAVKLKSDIAEIKTALEKTGNYKKRPASTGGDGEILTDC